MNAHRVAGTEASEAAIGAALAQHLRRYGAWAMQLHAASPADCAEALRQLQVLVAVERLVLLAPADLALPGEFAPLRAVRFAPGPDIGPGVSEIAASFDCLTHLDGAIILIFLGPKATPLPEGIARLAPHGAEFTKWLAASLGNATCGGGAAG